MIHVPWQNDDETPLPPETFWVLSLRARPGSGAGYDELKEYLAAVKLYADEVIESAKFHNGRKVLKIRVRSFKGDPEAFNWVLLRELNTWPELEVIDSREDPPCQACT